MSDHDAVLIVVREWVAKAENDLIAAELMLRAGRECPVDIVCFHAQQCAEKYIKAMLVLHRIPFPKTHDIKALMKLLPGGLCVDLNPIYQERLTRYATVTRYPGEYPALMLPEARRTVAACCKVRLQVRKLLPKAALQQPSGGRRRRLR